MRRQPHKARLIFVVPPDKYDSFKQQQLVGQLAGQQGGEGGDGRSGSSSGSSRRASDSDDGASSDTHAGVAGLASVTQYALCLSLDQDKNGGAGGFGSSKGASSTSTSTSTRALPGWTPPPSVGSVGSYRATGGNRQPTAFPSLRPLPRQPRSMTRSIVVHASHPQSRLPRLQLV